MSINYNKKGQTINFKTTYTLGIWRYAFHGADG